MHNVLNISKMQKYTSEECIFGTWAWTWLHCPMNIECRPILLRHSWPQKSLKFKDIFLTEKNPISSKSYSTCNLTWYWDN
jgi:hypothetical protein